MIPINYIHLTFLLRYQRHQMVRDLESVNDYEEYEPDDVPMMTNSGGSFSMDSEQEDVCTFQVGSSRNIGFDRSFLRILFWQREPPRPEGEE